MRNTRLFSVILSVAVGSTVVACQKKEKQDVEEIEDDGTPAVDPELAKAVAAASASASSSDDEATDEGGPPPNGVFAPGAADKELPRGGAPKITLGGEGAAPRKKLARVPAVGEHQVRVRLFGRQTGAPLDLVISLKVTPPEAEKPPTSDAGTASAGATAAKGLAVEATIQSANVDAARLAQKVSKELEDTVGKLKGSRLLFTLDETGCGRDFAIEPTKKSEDVHQDMLNSLAGVLATVTLPVPDKPVGAGAIWMATTRESVLGIDTLSYRLIKVEGFEGDQVILKIDTKRYAADARQTVPQFGAEGAVEFQQFVGQGAGVVSVPVAGGFPTQGKITRQLASAVLVGSQRMIIQERVDSSFEAITNNESDESPLQSPKPQSPKLQPTQPAAPPAGSPESP